MVVVILNWVLSSWCLSNKEEIWPMNKEVVVDDFCILAWIK